MNRWSTLALVLLLGAWPLNAQSSNARYLRDADQMCRATLADGTDYEVWKRVFVTEWEGRPLYVKVQAYYKPGSGEFLSWNTGLSEHGYASDRKENPPTPGASCELPYNHILSLKDGEWADFWASNGRVEVFHCNLKFETREKAWSYVVNHWQDGREGQSAKWVAEILLYQQLGRDFFRPKRLEFDARPYSYESLISAQKVGSNWRLEIKGADEPNSATVLLDSNFKLLKAQRELPIVDGTVGAVASEPIGLWSACGVKEPRNGQTFGAPAVDTHGSLVSLMGGSVRQIIVRQYGPRWKTFANVRAHLQEVLASTPRDVMLGEWWDEGVVNDIRADVEFREGKKAPFENSTGHLCFPDERGTIWFARLPLPEK